VKGSLAERWRAPFTLAGSPADFGKFIADETEKWGQGGQVLGHQGGLNRGWGKIFHNVSFGKIDAAGRVKGLTQT
jgi:hypothetical protein